MCSPIDETISILDEAVTSRVGLPSSPQARLVIKSLRLDTGRAC